MHVRRLGRLRAGSFHLRVQRELARLRGFDVVVESVNTIPFLTPLWRSRLPTTVPLFHQLAVDVWDAELPRPLARVGRWLELRLLKLYRETPVVAVSPSTRDDLVELGFKSVAVVANGRDEPPPDLAADTEGAGADVSVRRPAGGEQAARSTRSRRSARSGARFPMRGCG